MTSMRDLREIVVPGSSATSCSVITGTVCRVFALTPQATSIS